MSQTFTSKGTDYWVPTTAEDVTDDLAQAVLETVDGWFPEGKIEWDEVWDRMEGSDVVPGLPEGHALSWGDQVDTPAMRKVQRHVRKVRSQG